jgi:hypothetical protein
LGRNDEPYMARPKNSHEGEGNARGNDVEGACSAPGHARDDDAIPGEHDTQRNASSGRCSHRGYVRAVSERRVAIGRGHGKKSGHTEPIADAMVSAEGNASDIVMAWRATHRERQHWRRRGRGRRVALGVTLIQTGVPKNQVIKY